MCLVMFAIKGLSLLMKLNQGDLSILIQRWQQTKYIDDGCKRLFCVNVKGLYWFAFEQNESTPGPLDEQIDSLIYFVTNAQLYF